MKLPKIDISADKMQINAKFYFFLKYLVKAKLSDNQIFKILADYQLFRSAQALNEFKQSVIALCSPTTKAGQNQIAYLTDTFAEVNDQPALEVWIFSIKLLLIKDLLLQEAKLRQANNLQKLTDLHPLSLEYDKITVLNPYYTRVNGALLSLVFFNGLQAGFLSQHTDDFIRQFSKQAQSLYQLGVEPNQIFMLLFNESINQSITSDSGSDYEKRIKSVLLQTGIAENTLFKTHDKIDSSTEFDLFFELDGKTYGIGAKRTLRERYKQFIKTAQMSPIDVMIEITLGTDLTVEKANAIVNHGIYLFIAEEIYQNNVDWQNMANIYSCKDLTLATLKTLAKS